MLIEFTVIAGRVEHPVARRRGTMLPRGTRFVLDPDEYEAHAETVKEIRRRGGWSEKVVSSSEEEDLPPEEEEPLTEPEPEVAILPHQANVIAQLKRDALLG